MSAKDKRKQIANAGGNFDMLNAHALKQPPDASQHQQRHVFTIAQGNRLGDDVSEQHLSHENDTPSLFSPPRASHIAPSAPIASDQINKRGDNNISSLKRAQRPIAKNMKQNVLGDSFSTRNDFSSQYEPSLSPFDTQQFASTREPAVHFSNEQKLAQKHPSKPAPNVFHVDRDMSRAYEYPINRSKVHSGDLEESSTDTTSYVGTPGALPTTLQQKRAHCLQIPLDHRIFSPLATHLLNTPAGSLNYRSNRHNIDESPVDNDVLRDVQAYIDIVCREHPHVMRSWAYKQLMRNSFICELLSQGKLTLPRSMRPKNATCVRTHGVKCSQPTSSGLSALIPRGDRIDCLSSNMSPATAAGASCSHAVLSNMQFSETCYDTTSRPVAASSADIAAANAALVDASTSPRHRELLRPSISANIQHVGAPRRTNDILRSGAPAGEKHRARSRFGKSKHLWRDATDSCIELDAVRHWSIARDEQRRLAALHSHDVRLEREAEKRDARALLLQEEQQHHPSTSSHELYNTNNNINIAGTIPTAQILSNGAPMSAIHKPSSLPRPMVEEMLWGSELAAQERDNYFVPHITRKNRRFARHVVAEAQAEATDDVDESLNNDQHVVSTTHNHGQVRDVTTSQTLPDGTHTQHREITTPTSHASVFTAVRTSQGNDNDIFDEQSDDEDLMVSDMSKFSLFEIFRTPFVALSQVAANIADSIQESVSHGFISYASDDESQEDGNAVYHDSWGNVVANPHDGFITIRRPDLHAIYSARRSAAAAAAPRPAHEFALKDFLTPNLNDQFDLLCHEFYEFDPSLLPDDQLPLFRDLIVEQQQLARDRRLQHRRIASVLLGLPPTACFNSLLSQEELGKQQQELEQHDQFSAFVSPQFLRRRADDYRQLDTPHEALFFTIPYANTRYGLPVQFWGERFSF